MRLRYLQVVSYRQSLRDIQRIKLLTFVDLRSCRLRRRILLMSVAIFSSLNGMSCLRCLPGGDAGRSLQTKDLSKTSAASEEIRP